MIEALLFDLDGTLVVSNELHARAFARAFEKCGFKVPADRIVTEIGKGGDQLVPALLGARAEEEAGEAIRDEWKSAFLELLEREKVAVCPGALELLRACRERGLRLALATSGPQETLEAIEAASGVRWRDEFEVVTTAADASASKPAPHILLAALGKLKLSGAVCAMVGDTPFDALASRGAGVACVGVETGGHAKTDLREAGCRAAFPTTAEFLAGLSQTLHLCSPLEFALTGQKMEELMRAALDEARESLDRGEFPLGAVAANEHGEVVCTSRDLRASSGNPLERAELKVLEAAGDEAKIVVCPLEPNIAVAGAMIEEGVDCAVFGLESPLDGATHRLSSPRVPGQHFPRFLAGTLPDEAKELWQEWLERNPDDENARAIVEGAT